MASQPAPHAGAGNGSPVRAEGPVRLQFRSGVAASGHTCVPNVVLNDVRLELAARFAYAVLLQHASGERSAPLSLGELSRILGIGTRQSSAALQGLVQAGLLGIEREGDAQSVTYFLEPLESRYGPGGNQPPATGSRGGPSRFGSADRPGTNEARGAVIPVMTDRRRAFEDRLAASIPTSVPERTIDPALRELGLARARLLREQLKALPSGS